MGIEADKLENEPVLEMIKEKYLNSPLPLKIRKTELLRELGLPIPKSDFFPRTELAALKATILRRLSEDPRPLIVRVACAPDRFSMPSFFIDDAKNLEAISAKVGDLSNQDPTITHFILQNATPKDKVNDKIVGRMIFGSTGSLPLAKTIELYKGAKNASIFENVEATDPNYERLEQRVGEFTKPVSKSSAIGQVETKNVYNILTEHESQLEAARVIFAAGQNKPSDEVSTTFEFSYRDGNLVFVDID